MYYGSVIHKGGPTLENIWPPAVTELILATVSVSAWFCEGGDLGGG